MKIPFRVKRYALFGACFTFLSVIFSGGAIAEKPFPQDRPIKIYVPFQPGGATDTVIREAAALFSDEIQQKVEIIPPAPGETPKDVILKAAALPADGYHLCVGNVGTHSAAPAIEGVNLRYDPEENFIPIVMLGITPMVMMARSDFPGDNLKQIVREIRKNKRKYSIGHNGISSTSFLAAVQFSSIMKTELNFIPYGGSSDALEDLAYGYLDLFIDQSVSAAPYVNSGLVKAAVTTRKLQGKKGDIFSQIPSSQEAGIGEFNVIGWNMLFAPQNTPSAQVNYLNRKFLNVLENKILTARAAESYNERSDTDKNKPELLQIFISKQVLKWKKVIGIVKNSGGVEGFTKY